jgi:hypothetical protein
MRADVPVQRFRSIEEMNRALLPGTRGNDFERFLRHCARYRAIAPKDYPRGVFTFRTIEDAQHAPAMRAEPRSIQTGTRDD